MAHRFIGELQPGQRLDDEVYLVKSKDLRTTTQGSLYIHAVLVDRTGQLLARMWQASEEVFRDIPEGGFLRFKGRTENYKGNLQFIIDAIRPAETGSFDPADFVATTTSDVNQLWSRLREILDRIEHEELSALVQAFVADEELMARFRKAPAAATMHHAYLGGLIEHTVSVLELALLVVPCYPKLSLDLVLAGVFLHDIGKARELTYETSIGYSDEGQLLGHIAQAVIWIDKQADAVARKLGRAFPERLRWALEHIILAHHGKYEFGSPKLPAIPEAIVVHYLDNLDAKVHMFLAARENDRDPASAWTEYQRALETKVYKPDVMAPQAD